MKSSTLLAVLPLVSYASAHGYLRQLAIDGNVYRGNIPNVSNFTSPIRVINAITPVKGATNRAVNCGNDAAIAQMVAPAMPGSSLTFDWAGGDNGKWPHNTGPMLTYLSTCGNTTCDQFDAINAKWFKIDEVGKSANGTWFQQDIMNGNTYTTHLPTNLAPGDYLVRHEIIALHLGNEPGGAEFYPACSQIRVGGNGTGMPQATVALPGAYSDTDPGILVPSVFTPGANYTSFPGPAIDPSLASGGVAITGPAPSTTGMPTPPSAVPSAPAAAPASVTGAASGPASAIVSAPAQTSAAAGSSSTVSADSSAGMGYAGYRARRSLGHVMRFFPDRV